MMFGLGLQVISLRIYVKMPGCQSVCVLSRMQIFSTPRYFVLTGLHCSVTWNRKIWGYICSSADWKADVMVDLRAAISTEAQ